MLPFTSLRRCIAVSQALCCENRTSVTFREWLGSARDVLSVELQPYTNSIDSALTLPSKIRPTRRSSTSSRSKQSCYQRGSVSRCDIRYRNRRISYLSEESKLETSVRFDEVDEVLRSEATQEVTDVPTNERILHNGSTVLYM